MKRSLINSFLAVLLGAVTLMQAATVQAAESDGEAAARKIALDLAGAFSNDGFKLRDGHWTGNFEIGKAQLIQVNLCAGNQYWFSLAATPPAQKVAVSLYDETGRPVEVDAYNDGAKAAAGFSPNASGPYFLKVEQITGDPATFCLIYSYK